mgnify:CR=1 FL=1
MSNLSELIGPIYLLEEDMKPNWGKMSCPQMIKHCNRFIQVYVNEVKFNYIAEEYRDSNIKSGQDDKALVKEKIDKKEKKFAKKQDKKIKEYESNVS